MRTATVHIPLLLALLLPTGATLAKGEAPQTLAAYSGNRLQ